MMLLYTNLANGITASFQYIFALFSGTMAIVYSYIKKSPNQVSVDFSVSFSL